MKAIYLSLREVRTITSLRTRETQSATGEFVRGSIFLSYSLRNGRTKRFLSARRRHPAKKKKEKNGRKRQTDRETSKGFRQSTERRKKKRRIVEEFALLLPVLPSFFPSNPGPIGGIWMDFKERRLG